ncbi:MAG TPA: serine protease [Syntrophomonadaceae bacterium]|nr:serine protease [Syntrophomonadaceae bacterium]
MDKTCYTNNEHPDADGHQYPHTSHELDDEDVFDEEKPYRSNKSFFYRVVAVICLLAFTALSFPNLAQLFKEAPTYLRQSRELSSQQFVQLSIPAIVKVEAVQVNDILSPTRQQGTGFNIQPTGLVVTNQHVVEKAREVKISFADGSSFISQNIKAIPGLDLALVQFQGSNLPCLEVNTEKFPDRGAVLTIIGNPSGYLRIPVAGPLLDYVKITGSQSLIMLIQAPIAPGSSGSPVLNTKGQVVAVVFAYNRDSVKGADQALAIPLAGLSEKLTAASLP